MSINIGMSAVRMGTKMITQEQLNEVVKEHACLISISIIHSPYAQNPILIFSAFFGGISMSEATIVLTSSIVIKS